MSRNLCTLYCRFCGTMPTLSEHPRPIRKEEAKIYFKDYEGMLVADAECSVCGAEYLAWVDERTITGKQAKYFLEDGCHPRFASNGFFDLSFRSTFNDDYGVKDVPKSHMIRMLARSHAIVNLVEPIAVNVVCGLVKNVLALSPPTTKKGKP